MLLTDVDRSREFWSSFLRLRLPSVVTATQTQASICPHLPVLQVYRDSYTLKNISLNLRPSSMNQRIHSPQKRQLIPCDTNTGINPSSPLVHTHILDQCRNIYNLCLAFQRIRHCRSVRNLKPSPICPGRDSLRPSPTLMQGKCKKRTHSPPLMCIIGLLCVFLPVFRPVFPFLIEFSLVSFPLLFLSLSRIKFDQAALGQTCFLSPLSLSVCLSVSPASLSLSLSLSLSPSLLPSRCPSVLSLSHTPSHHTVYSRRVFLSGGQQRKHLSHLLIYAADSLSRSSRRDTWLSADHEYLRMHLSPLRSCHSDDQCWHTDSSTDSGH